EAKTATQAALNTRALTFIRVLPAPCLRWTLDASPANAVSRYAFAISSTTVGRSFDLRHDSHELLNAVMQVLEDRVVAEFRLLRVVDAAKTIERFPRRQVLGAGNQDRERRRQ